MRVICIAHPYTSDPVGSAGPVRDICRGLALEGHLPIAPQIYLPHFIDEATERALALRFCLELVALCDEVRVYRKPTDGMRLEIAEGRRLGIPIVNGETGEVMHNNGEPPR